MRQTGQTSIKLIYNLVHSVCSAMSVKIFGVKYLSYAMQKCAIGTNADSKGPDQTAHPQSDPQSDQGLHCLLIGSLDTVEYINV